MNDKRRFSYNIMFADGERGSSYIMPRHARILSSRINNLRVKLRLIERGECEPFVITKEHTFPEEKWRESWREAERDVRKTKNE